MVSLRFGYGYYVVRVLGNDTCNYRSAQKGFRLKKEEDNAYAYIQGIYVRDALASTVGNMFRKKGSKAIEYPSEPYGMYKDEQIEEVQDGEEIMTEDEKRRKTEALFMQLRLMQANFELSKQAKKYEGEQ